MDHRPPVSSQSDGDSAASPSPEEIPLPQRLMERPFLLLVLGVLIMAVFYTGWGLFEITSLDPAPLP